MEIIIAIIAGTGLGTFIGWVISRSKHNELYSTIDKLKWQLDGEKANAEVISSNLQEQIKATKKDAKEQIESIIADCEKRIAEIKSDAENQTLENLSAQEK